jgi:hypothetical protein
MHFFFEVLLLRFNVGSIQAPDVIGLTVGYLKAAAAPKSPKKQIAAHQTSPVPCHSLWSQDCSALQNLIYDNRLQPPIGFEPFPELRIRSSAPSLLS